MDTWVIVAIVVVAVLLLAAAVGFWAYRRRRRTTELRDTFGPEYDRVVRDRGQGAGEKELAERRDRVKVFNVRPLSPDEHDLFTSRWTESQTRFVDDPSGAITEADDLVMEVMKARGYPVEEEFEHRADDISVEYPDLVSNYRSAHEVATRHERGEATTEELRRAMVNYRALFADLLERGADRDREGAQRTAEADRHA